MRLTYLHEPVVIGVQTAGICLIDFDDGQKIFVCHQYFVLVVQNAGQINSPVNVMTKTELWNVACRLFFFDGRYARSHTNKIQKLHLYHSQDSNEMLLQGQGHAAATCKCSVYTQQY